MAAAWPEDKGSAVIGVVVEAKNRTRGDLLKAEEYCERAILVKPDDGEVLSMYGDLIWNNHRDGDRAKYYFDRALQASPEDW
ncbi:Tetratricopeptide-like helical [Corchorus olitorius]|uniref:Tetratricopeptide-like helical n=1 Tax=Corchorus olitorius TaxID=93759 RepID=A0A1R3J7M8_9ROSI|nr:Tetratricopeptide-like helical [Corchorus olitorius]